MIVPNFVRQWHAEIEAPARAVQEAVRDTLRPFCEENRYLFLDRLKDVESTAEKLESGRYGRLDDLDDLYAATIVVPTLRHDGPVVRHLEGIFRTVQVRGRARTRKDPEVFRFDSTRFYGRLKPSVLGRDPRIDGLLFEVQVQTAFEHAWVAVTHDAVYKGAVVDWRRQRLAASLKAAVEQIDLLVVGFDSAVEEIPVHEWEGSRLRQMVLDHFTTFANEGRIDELLKPRSWVRFSNNFVSLCESEGGASKTKTQKVVEDSLAALRNCLGGAGWVSPKSLSLFQMTLGVLVKENVVKMSPGKYACLVDQALADVFPEVRRWSPPVD